MTLTELRQEYGLSPKKSLGQNFLTEEHIIRQIADAALSAEGDMLLEIGSGPGILTEYLAGSGRPLVCVETDHEMADILRSRFGSFPDVTIAEADFLKWDMSPLAGRKTVCVGNLPYYITTPIIERILARKELFSTAIFMVQKEVGDRLLAAPGTREAGSVTLFCQYYSEISRVCRVSRGCFWPAPKVDSCVLRFDIRKEPAVEVPDDEQLFDIIRAAFGQRRKTLRSSLKNSGFLWWGEQKTSAVLAHSGVDGTKRGEALTLEEFARLARSAAVCRNPGETEPDK